MLWLALDIAAAIIRATASAMPPGAKPTTMRETGVPWASTVGAAARPNPAEAVEARKRRREKANVMKGLLDTALWNQSSWVRKRSSSATASPIDAAVPYT